MTGYTGTHSKNPILKLFPTPKFLAMPFVGLSFSDRHVRYVEFRKKGWHRNVELKNYSTINLPPNVIVNGEIRDPKKLTELLTELKEEFSINFVRASLPEEKGYLYSTEIPYEPGEDIYDGVGFTLEENAPIAVTEALYDYRVIEVDSQKHLAKTVVTVFPRDFVEAYLNVLSDAGITVLSFELEAVAVARSVVNEEDPKTYMVIHRFNDKIGLYMVSKNVVFFTSTFSLGVDSISANTQKEADEAAGSNMEYQSPDVGLVNAEIEKLAGYWASHVGGGINKGKIEGLILCGAGVNDKVFFNNLVKATKFKVEYANVWQNIFSLDDYVPSISADLSLEYSVAVGLALSKTQ
jgi:Tfp pilus assembly PilM family ATPase